MSSNNYKIKSAVYNLTPFEISKIVEMVNEELPFSFYKELANRYTNASLSNKETALFYKLIKNQIIFL